MKTGFLKVQGGSFNCAFLTVARNGMLGTKRYVLKVRSYSSSAFETIELGDLECTIRNEGSSVTPGGLIGGALIGGALFGGLGLLGGAAMKGVAKDVTFHAALPDGRSFIATTTLEKYLRLTRVTHDAGANKTAEATGFIWFMTKWLVLYPLALAFLGGFLMIALQAMGLASK